MERNESMDQLVAVVGGVESVLEVEAHRKQLSLVVGAREDNSRDSDGWCDGVGGYHVRGVEC